MSNAEKAILELSEAGQAAFITLQSDGESELVVCRFLDDDASFRFHSALTKCGRIARELKTKTTKTVNKG